MIYFVHNHLKQVLNFADRIVNWVGFQMLDLGLGRKV